MLDMFSSENAAGAKPTINEGDRLPATFGDSFDAAYHDMDLFSNSGSAFSARTQALNEYVGMVQRAGGNYEAHLPKPSELQKRYPVGVYSEEDKLNAANGALGELGPNQYLPPPMTMDDVGRRADELMAGARLSLQAQQSKPQTLASGLGSIAGSAVGGLSDPLNLPLMVMAPEFGGANVLKAALGWGAVSGGTQFLNEVAGMRARERALPGYAESGAPTENIAEAIVGGAVVGGALKGFANVLERIHTGQWPRSLQDAANVVKSEDNIAKTNVLPGAEGDGEHRAALGTAMDQILRGQAVDVNIGEASRAIMARADAERQGFAAPRSANMAEISRLSEEGGLNARRSEIMRQLTAMPMGDLSAADRLNRLEAVESQLGRAESAADRQRLNDRRDQILVDTNPEQLQKAAQPIQDRHALEQEHANVSSRLNEIGEERARERLAAAAGPSAPRAQALAPAPLAQAERVPRTLFDIHEQRIGDLAALREGAQRAGEKAVAEPPRTPNTLRVYHGSDHGKPRSGWVTPHRDYAANYYGEGTKLFYADLPIGSPEEIKLRATEPEDEAAGAPRMYRHDVIPELIDRLKPLETEPTHLAALRQGIQRLALGAGYSMPEEEAAKLAERVAASGSDEEARAILQEAALRPRTILSTLPSTSELRQAESAASREAAEAAAPRETAQRVTPESLKTMLADPKETEAQFRDLERTLDAQAQSGKQAMINVADAEGNPTVRTLASVMDEALADRKAAEALEACTREAVE